MEWEIQKKGGVQDGMQGPGKSDQADRKVIRELSVEMSSKMQDKWAWVWYKWVFKMASLDLFSKYLVNT